MAFALCAFSLCIGLCLLCVAAVLLLSACFAPCTTRPRTLGRRSSEGRIAASAARKMCSVNHSVPEPANKAMVYSHATAASIARSMPTIRLAAPSTPNPRRICVFSFGQGGRVRRVAGTCQCRWPRCRSILIALLGLFAYVQGLRCRPLSPQVESRGQLRSARHRPRWGSAARRSDESRQPARELAQGSDSACFGTRPPIAKLPQTLFGSCGSAGGGAAPKRAQLLPHRIDGSQQLILV